MHSNGSSRAFAQLFFTASVILGLSPAARASDSVIHVSFERTERSCEIPLNGFAPRELSEAERTVAFDEIMAHVARTPTLHAIITLGDDFKLREWRTGSPDRLHLSFEYEPNRSGYAIWVEGANPFVTYVIRDVERRHRLKELITRRSAHNQMSLLYPGEGRPKRLRLMDAYVL